MNLNLNFRSLAATVALFACGSAALAEEVKLPVATGEQGTIYVEPKVTPTETAATAQGASVGIEGADGGGGKIGVDTSGQRPTYSVGGSTGGNTSFNAGAHSDGKANTGVKAGVKIRF